MGDPIEGMDAIYAMADEAGGSTLADDLPCWLRSGFNWHEQMLIQPTATLSRINVLALATGQRWDDVAYLKQPVHRMLVRIETALGLETVSHPDHSHPLQIGRRVRNAEEAIATGS